MDKNFQIFKNILKVVTKKVKNIVQKFEFFFKNFGQKFSNFKTRETEYLHFKEHTEYSEILQNKFGDEQLTTVFKDLKQSPLVLLDFIVDVMLIALLVIKLTVFSLDFG